MLARGTARPRPAALLFAGSLAALAAWAAASVLWTEHVTASVLDTQRLLLYAAAAALVVLTPSVLALLAGVLAAATLLCGVGLAEWLLGEPGPTFSADPQAAERLSAPLGYANGVAITAVLGLLLAAGLAERLERTAWAAVAAAPVPILAASLYFTFGRGAWLALGAGLALAVALSRARLRLAAVAAALALPAAAAVGASAWLGAGGAVAATLPVLCLLAAALPPALRRAPAPPRPVRAAFAGSLVALPLLAVAAVLAAAGGPRGLLDAFASSGAPVHGDVSGRVLSLSGSSRADYWGVAWESFREHPALGAGAGTFGRSWLRERPVPQPAQDAHSLYLETLAELGPLGLALLLAALSAPFAAARSRWAPAALGAYGAFLVHAAQDWDWELPAVTVSALFCGGALLAGAGPRRLPRASAAVAAALAVLVLPGYLGNRALERAVDAQDSLAWAEAVESARTARQLQPWSPEPWRVLGEVELAEGSLAEARRLFRRGLDEDPDEYELWIGLGLAAEDAAAERAFRRAALLNPLAPELRELRE